MGGVEPGVLSAAPLSSLIMPSQLERSMDWRRTTDDVAAIREEMARCRLLCRVDTARVKESSSDVTAAVGEVVVVLLVRWWCCCCGGGFKDEDRRKGPIRGIRFLP